MPDRTNCEPLVRHMQPFFERAHRGVSRSPRAVDHCVARVFAVAGIIHQEKSVAVNRIIYEDVCQPMQRERAVAAKRDPEAVREYFSAWNVKRRAFSGRHPVVNLDAICWKLDSVTRIVRPRMINHRVLPKENKRRNRKRHDQEPNRNAKPACRNSSLTTFTGHFAIKKMQSMRWRKSMPLISNIDLSMPVLARIQRSAETCDEFIANDQQSRPSRWDGEPNGLLPTQRPALVAPPNCRAPTRNPLRSTANNHVSRHIPTPGPLFAFQPERRAEPWTPPPPGLDRLLSLLAWLSSWSPSLVPQRSRQTPTALAPIHKY